MPQSTRTGPLLIGIGGFGYVLAAGVAAYFLGTINVQRNINFVPNGNSTGAVIQINGTTQFQVLTTACTNTGGLAKYPTCLVRSPLTTTGALTNISLECGSINKALTMSGGFVKTSTDAVGAAFTSYNDVAVATGATLPHNAALTGSYILWNPADMIKFQSVTTMPAGGIDCIVRAMLYDKYGN